MKQTVSSLETQVPGHDGLAYLNMGVIDDVMEHRGIVVQGLPINHTKSPDRWKNVRTCQNRTTSCHPLGTLLAVRAPILHLPWRTWTAATVITRILTHFKRLHVVASERYVRMRTPGGRQASFCGCGLLLAGVHKAHQAHPLQHCLQHVLSALDRRDNFLNGLLCADGPAAAPERA